MDALLFCPLSGGWIRTGRVVNWVPVAPKSPALREPQRGFESNRRLPLNKQLITLKATSSYRFFLYRCWFSVNPSW